MEWLFRTKEDCFCAFCKSKRRIYTKKHLDIINVVIVFVFSVSLATGIWAWWDPRSLVFIGLGLGVAEAFVYLRWRFTVVCNMCGFDPVLYRKSTDKARAKVALFYKEKIHDTKFQFSGSPLLEIHRKTQERKRKNQWVQQRSEIPETTPKSPTVRPKTPAPRP